MTDKLRLVSVSAKDDDSYMAIFERDGIEVRKTVRSSSLAKKIASDSEDVRLEWMYQFMKAAREADRDIAFKIHGDDFRRHCEYQTNFSKPLDSDQFLNLLRDVA